MGRPKGSLNKSTLAEMTGGAPQGEPDPEAQRIIDEANSVPDDAEVVDEAPAYAPAPASDPGDLQAQILKALESPEVATRVVEIASGTQEGRRLLGLTPGQGVPSGEGEPNYDRPELRVMGGVEVRHAPGFQRLPPSYIKRYLRADGSKTDYAAPKIDRITKSVPARAEDGKVVINADGLQVFEDQTVDVVKDPGAAKDAKGRPIKTDEYKQWLDATEHGGRYNGDATTLVDQQMATDGTPAVRLNDDGAPVTAGPAIEMTA
jgi:hypothetical protein